MPQSGILVRWGGGSEIRSLLQGRIHTLCKENTVQFQMNQEKTRCENVNVRCLLVAHDWMMSRPDVSPATREQRR